MTLLDFLLSENQLNPDHTHGRVAVKEVAVAVNVLPDQIPLVARVTWLMSFHSQAQRRPFENRYSTSPPAAAVQSNYDSGGFI